MKFDSPLFDRIRVRRTREEAPRATRACEWPDCGKPGTHRAPKGRGREGEYWRYCLDHVREYNLKWNFFHGATEEEFLEMVESRPFGDIPDEPESRLDATFRGGAADAGAIVAGRRIPGVPESQAFARLQWNSGGPWSAAFEAEAMGDVVVNDAGTASAPGYGLLHAEASHRWTTAAGELWRFAPGREGAVRRILQLGARGIGGFVDGGDDDAGAWAVRARMGTTLAGWMKGHGGPVPWRDAVAIGSGTQSPPRMPVPPLATAVARGNWKTRDFPEAVGVAMTIPSTSCCSVLWEL